MAARRNIRKGFKMPWQAPRELLSEKMGIMFQAFATIRVSCGPSFTRLPEGVTKRHANLLIKEGWLGKDRATKRYYQIATHKIFKFVEGQERVFIPAEWVRMKDGDAVLYHALVGNYTKVHPTAAAPMQEARKRSKKPHHTRSEHNGGMAHSEVNRLTGMSVGKSSYLRARCMALGLCHFTQRFVPTSHDCAFHGKVMEGDPRHLFDGHSRPMARLTSRYTPIMEVEFSRVGRWRRDKKAGTVGEGDHGMFNFTSGGSKACYF